MNKIVVTLTPKQINQVIKIAERRNAEQRKHHQKDGLVATEKSSVGADIEGAIGEGAFAKAFALKWDGSFKKHAEWLKWRHDGHDVSGLEIKTTRYRTGRLLVQKWNRDDAPYILAIITSDLPSAIKNNKKIEIELVGWCIGQEAKNDLWWVSEWRRPCYALPQNQLRDMSELMDIYNLDLKRGEIINSI